MWRIPLGSRRGQNGGWLTKKPQQPNLAAVKGVLYRGQRALPVGAPTSVAELRSDRFGGQ